MTPKQDETFKALAWFIEQNGASPSQSQLAEIIKTSQSSASKIIDKLVAAGFVRKIPNTHCGLYLTEAGKAKWEEIKR